MALLQKITRPTVRILGTDYSPRIVGLHNRVRAHARRLLVYKDIEKLARPAAEATRGVFAPGRKRLVIYLRRGAPETTVAHELTHALLYGEGFLPLRCRSYDLTRHPGIGVLAERIHDLIVHPVVVDRLRRSGYAPDSGRTQPVAPDPRGGRRRPQTSRPRPGADEALKLLAHAVGAAEALHRLPAAQTPHLRRALERLLPGLWRITKEIARAAPWDSSRTALEARILAARVVRRLEESVEDLLGSRPRLTERILMPAYLTRRRLLSPATALFDARTAELEANVVIIFFKPDGAACSARSFADPARAAKAAESVRREMQEMSASQLIERHRLEYLLLEGGRRCSARTGGRPPDAEVLFTRLSAKERPATASARGGGGPMV